MNKNIYFYMWFYDDKKQSSCQARLEKDLAELKKMIENHFVQRKQDEEEIQNLEKRIEERKTVSINSSLSFPQIFM